MSKQLSNEGAATLSQRTARHVAACLLGMSACSWCYDLSAAETDAAPVQAPDASRTAIKVLVLGERGQQMQPALEALIDSELQDSNAQLSFESQAGRVRSWVERARLDEHTLLLAVVDTRKDLSWRVYIVDAARGRATARDLPGGVEQNQAAVEAVASIVVSATAALREGLEVASKPVEEVVAPEEAAAEAEPSSEPAPDTEPLPEATHEEEPKPGVPPKARAGSRRYHFRAAVLSSAAAFAEPEPVSFGGRLALGISTPADWVLGLSAGRHLPVEVTSTLGRFEVHRSTAELFLGYLLPFGLFELEVEASAQGEVFERRGGKAEETATAHAGRTFTRVGGLLGARGRYRVFGPVALELGLGAAYFPRPVRFLSAPEGQEIAVLWKVMPRVELGIEFQSP